MRLLMWMDGWACWAPIGRLVAVADAGITFDPSGPVTRALFEHLFPPALVPPACFFLAGGGGRLEAYPSSNYTQLSGTSSLR